MQSLSKHQWYFSENQKKIILKFVWKHKGSKKAKTNLRKNRPGGIMPPDLRLYYKTSHQNSMVLAQNTDQWNRIEDPKINLCTYGQTMTKGTRIHNGEKTGSSISGAEKTGQLFSLHKIRKLEHSLTQYIKINSKWIKDLNARPETIKLLEEI